MIEAAIPAAAGLQLSWTGIGAICAVIVAAAGGWGRYMKLVVENTVNNALKTALVPYVDRGVCDARHKGIEGDLGHVARRVERLEERKIGGAG
jgi:hypothetical protein